MSRSNQISVEIYRSHNRFYRYLNNTWIFITQVRPLLKGHGDSLVASKSRAKKRYPVPKRNRVVVSKRRDAEIGKIFIDQFDHGIFETNIVGAVSRAEAFINECVVIAIRSHPEKLSIISERSGIPFDLFLEHDDRDDVLESYVTLRCQDLMFGKPSDYISKIEKVLSIKIDDDIVADYIEIKASRDLIVHNLGIINKLYRDKAGSKSRGDVGGKLVVDLRYFKHVVESLKRLSGVIQRETEKKFK